MFTRLSSVEAGQYVLARMKNRPQDGKRYSITGVTVGSAYETLEDAVQEGSGLLALSRFPIFRKFANYGIFKKTKDGRFEYVQRY